LFIAVVVFFPRGIAGLMTDQIIPKLGFWKSASSGERGPAPAPSPAPAE